MPKTFQRFVKKAIFCQVWSPALLVPTGHEGVPMYTCEGRKRVPISTYLYLHTFTYEGQTRVLIRILTRLGLVLGLRSDLNQKFIQEVNKRSVQNKKNNSSNY